eukprot:symbB.v1.2.014113.t1/scaffold1015.1/size144109/1
MLEYHFQSRTSTDGVDRLSINATYLEPLYLQGQTIATGQSSLAKGDEAMDRL